MKQGHKIMVRLNMDITTVPTEMQMEAQYQRTINYFDHSQFKIVVRENARPEILHLCGDQWCLGVSFTGMLARPLEDSKVHVSPNQAILEVKLTEKKAWSTAVF